MSLTFGSLFAGIGGFDLGLERSGMQCAWQVEIDPFCQKVLAKHWPDVERHGDVRDVGSHNLKAVDLICGGFPCQPHSVAGKRRGAADDRDLWPEYRRVVAELRPRWVVGENVPGIRHTILDQVLSDLEGLDYTPGTLVIPACAFDAPHRRERVFVVAYTETHRGDNEGEDAKQGLVDREEVSWMGLSRGSLRRTDNQQQSMADPHGEALERATIAREECHTWDTEPNVGRVAHGIPNRVDRLRALGNAVVPQVAEWIGQQIMTVATGA